MNDRRSLILILLFAGGLSIDARPVSAQQPQPDLQYKLKADWMYHFGNSLVDWGNNNNQHFVIGVLGGYPGDLQQQLARIQRLTGRRGINGKPLRIKQFDSIANYERCDILFISRKAAAGRTESSLRRLQDAQGMPRRSRSRLLIVSESPGFARRGAMINFTVNAQRNRLTMEINPGATKTAGLELATDTISQAITETVRPSN